MEADDGSSGLATAPIAPQAISSHYSSLGEFFRGSDLVESVTDVDDNNNNNNNENIINDDNNDDNLNNRRPISRVTLGDVLDIDKKKPVHSNPFFRSKLKPGTRFFCNPRPLLSKLSLNNKKPTPPQNNPFFHNPQTGTLGVVLNGDKKPSNFCSPWPISKMTINNVFNRNKKPSPPNNPSQPVSKLALGVVFDSNKKPAPTPTAKKHFLRSLLANIRNNGLKVQSGLNKKSWKSSNLCRRLNQDDPFHYVSNSIQNENQNQNQNQNQDQNQDQDMNMDQNSLTNSTGSDYSPRRSDTLETEYTLVTESNHDDVAFKEVDGEWSIENSGSFDSPMDAVVRKEKTQKKFSRELFVMCN
ncbi:hypothetical protein Cgig2_029967 [Carnegiea gigantea]|uniref:Uncharacterized protein n=1 Tax=Carnegiea gigantea TaxID=171969 RepID=A0A9Q1JPA6_9CARY|nr:hypothetical protein Cgig2_029967 [Carnegiea gigantea]